MGVCQGSGNRMIEDPVNVIDREAAGRASQVLNRSASGAASQWKAKCASAPPSELYTSYQGLLDKAGATYHNLEKSGFKQGDMLFIIDMQNDFIPATDAPLGGRFGVSDGAATSGPIVDLIEKAAAAGIQIVASRDYHPKNHCSFNTSDPAGPFPPHCVQGNAGSFFFPPIEDALKTAKGKGADVSVVFKGFCKDADSFGALRYTAQYFEDRGVGHGKPADTQVCSCCLVDWTGSFSLECSNLDEDLNAPPDVMAVYGRKPLKDQLSKIQRLFVVGLALDFCVSDSALNASNLSIAPGGVFIPIEACRAAYIPGVGEFDGFLSPPADLVKKWTNAGVKLVHTNTMF